MLVGEIVATRFEIGALAGTGGMGAVYRARDTLTGEPVALKLLAPSRDPQRFLREGGVLAELSREHPAIVRYVAHGTTPDGQAYLAMEWLEGEDLAERLARGPLGVRAAIALVRRAAEALTVAHARGVVHRDIKPSNLFLARPYTTIDSSRGELVDGSETKETLKVLDFGIARLARSTHTRAHTQAGALLGTPGYMAPEQALGDGSVDARADVFALGCVLFECLTGKPAFAADHLMALLAKIVLEDAPRVRELADHVPAALDELVARMLSKDASGRPADAAAVVAKIDALGKLPTDEARVAPSSGFSARLTEREQRVVSIVLAGADARADDVAQVATIEMEAATKTVERVRRIMAPYGARLEWLADGSLIGTLAGHGTAADQATQAARCALAIRERLEGAPVVVCTGRTVVAGRLPMGEVIDRATRLLRSARTVRAANDASESSVVRLDEVTAGLLDARFEVGGDGDHEGLVLRGEREHFDATRKLLGKPTTLVGRDREKKTLEATFAECVSEPVARAVIVTSPAGFGKSRLRYEFLRDVQAAGGVEIWHGRGDPMSAGSPFGMLAQALRRAAGIREGEPIAVRQRKLRGRVARHVEADAVSRVTEFLAELVGAPFPENTSVQLRAARAEPMLMGDQMLRAWEDFALAETAAQPVLLVLEDLHWGDVPTVRFVDTLLRNLHDRPLMVLALARPDVSLLFPRLWSERRTQEIRLEELTKKASERLVRQVLGDGVANEIVARIVARAGGNAFYLEELIRSVAERAGGAAGASESDALPETVIAMAQARLDALDTEARLLLRAASVFGETFWTGAVRALLGGDKRGPDPRATLDDLVRRELVTSRAEARFTGETEYRFRHALVREAAYATLTDSDKKLGHKLAADWLAKVDERDDMLLAEHYERGGAPEAAILRYVAAASQALQGNDFAAAIARAERGVTCGAREQTLGQCLLLQAEAHRWIGEFAASERAARAALDHLTPRSALWFAAAGELASASGLLGNHDELEKITHALRDASGKGDVSAPLAIAAARAAVQLLHAGRYASAADVIDVLEAAAEPLAATDPAVAGWLGRARTIQAGKSGDTEAGCRASEASATRLEEAGDLRTACLQRMNLGYYYDELGAYADAERTLREALAHAQRMGLHHVTAPGKTFLGYALGGLGRLKEALACEHEAADAFAAQGDRRMEAAARNHIARFLVASGDARGGAHEAEKAVALCAQVPSMRATSYGSLATALLAANDATAALAAANEGMTILASLGGMDQGEARLRLAHVRALMATGDASTAKSAIEKARERLVARAEKMSSVAWRESFLERVPENAETIALAKSLVDAPDAVEAGERATKV